MVGTDRVLVYLREFSILTANNSKRIVVSQSDNLNLCRNNYTIVRSNDGVTLCHLSSNEGEREALTSSVLTEDSTICCHTYTITLFSSNITSALSPSLEHRQQRATVNVEGNSKNTILSRDAVLARSCSDSTCSTCVNLSVVLEE